MIASYNPTLNIKPWMMFVDGENFAINGRKSLEDAGLQLDGSKGPWIPDVFLWDPHRTGDARLPPLPSTLEGRSIRSYFYTSATGDEDALEATRSRIYQCGFHPEVFKRKKNGRSKGVDIALARDLLAHAFEGHFEVAILVAGDADYLPLVHEVKRRGRRILLAFFGDSPAMSPQLRLACDAFYDVRESFLTSWREVLKR